MPGRKKKKIISPVLKKIIADFNLNKNDVIEFHATVDFNSDKVHAILPVKIQVVTIENKHIDVIYLLNVDENIPSMFIINEVKINYKRDKSLLITGKSTEHGNYEVIISPVNYNLKAFSDQFNLN